MTHWQVSVPLGTLPIQLVCISDASVALVRTSNFATIFDGTAVFANESFTIANVEYEYNKKVYYKQVPEFLAWLVAQNLELPEIQQ